MSDKENIISFPIGTAIRKQFGDEWFEGVIDEYAAPWYHVTYTDGDHEDMTLQEVQMCLKRKSTQEIEQQHPKRSKLVVREEETRGRSRRTASKVVSYTEDDFMEDDDEDEETYRSRKKKSTARRTKDEEEDESDVDEVSSAASEDLGVDVSLDSEAEEGEEEVIAPPRKGRKSDRSQKKEKKKPSPPKRKVTPKKSNARKSKNPNEHSASDATNRILKSPYTAGDGLPPLCEPQDMFDDMIEKLSTEVDLTCLHNKEFRVATMCSGTESPLLAADMISNALWQHHSIRVHWTHVFSCEIEPFKQAYIERNFQPPLLFRDIRELGEEQATTAYGALRDVPLDVDVLIAGTSCVDYSNLNNAKKELNDLGESGQTFHG
jgi:hypothetical protein